MSKPFHVALMQPHGYVHALALLEAGEYLVAMLARCGHAAQLAVNQLRPQAHNVVLCAHLLQPAALARVPADTIMFNSEQLDDTEGWHLASGPYRETLARFYVWDYDAGNLSRVGHSRKDLVPFGFCAELVRAQIPREPGRNLVFYGALTPRRKRILDAIAARGVPVDYLFGVYGRERDEKIFRAWAVLNLHKTDDLGVFEPIRCFYPLCNDIPVISEDVPEDRTLEAFREGIFFVDSARFVDGVAGLHADETRFRTDAAEKLARFRAASPLDAFAATVRRYLAHVAA